MSPRWKYTTRTKKKLCKMCGAEIHRAKIMMCEDCWKYHEFQPREGRKE